MLTHIYTVTHIYSITHLETCTQSYTLSHNSHTYSLTHMRIQLHIWAPTTAHTYTVSHTRTITHMHMQVPHTQSHVENLTWPFVLSILRPGNLIRWVHWALTQTHLFPLLCCPSVSYSRRNGGPMSSDLVGNIDKGEIQRKSLIIKISGEPRCVCLFVSSWASSTAMLQGLSSSEV